MKEIVLTKVASSGKRKSSTAEPPSACEGIEKDGVWGLIASRLWRMRRQGVGAQSRHLYNGLRRTRCRCLGMMRMRWEQEAVDNSHARKVTHRKPMAWHFRGEAGRGSLDHPLHRPIRPRSTSYRHDSHLLVFGAS